MPSTYASLHYHIVFSTKDREPWLDASWRTRVHEYLGGTIHRLEAIPEIIGGTVDHVHLLVGLKPTHRLADLVREVKKASSVWVHDEMRRSAFAWQEGYAVFTVSATARESVREYIARQEEHHRGRTFRDELIAMLEKAGVEYDARYLDYATSTGGRTTSGTPPGCAPLCHRGSGGVASLDPRLISAMPPASDFADARVCVQASAEVVRAVTRI